MFTYVGDLDAVFAGAARVLQAGGVFAFSVEVAEDDGEPMSCCAAACAMRTRAATSRRWRNGTASSVRRLVRQPFREDQRTMIEAWYGVLSR